MPRGFTTSEAYHQDGIARTVSRLSGNQSGSEFVHLAERRLVMVVIPE